MKEVQRQSNFESLRIVAMALIVTHHYVVNSTVMDQFATGIVKPFFDRFLSV